MTSPTKQVKMNVIQPTHTLGTLEFKNASETAKNEGIAGKVVTQAADLNLEGVESFGATINKSVSAPGAQATAN